MKTWQYYIAKVILFGRDDFGPLDRFSLFLLKQLTKTFSKDTDIYKWFNT